MLNQKNSNPDLEKLFEMSPDMLCIAGPDGHFTKVNTAFSRQLGYGEQELLRMHIVDLVHPSDADRTRRMLARSIKGNPTRNFENSCRHADGHYMPVSWSADAEGPTGPIYAVAHDLTGSRRLERDLNRALRKTVHVLSAALEARDPYTAGHEERVAQIAVQIADRLGIDEHQIIGIELAATIHDIGKIQIPAEILSSPRLLTDNEMNLVREHPVVGAELVADLEFEWLIADAIRQHHERMDGSGYPFGLRGDEIILDARVIAVADTLEAMASHRPYRPGLGLPVAADEIRKGAGTAFDPDVAAACLSLVDEGCIELLGAAA